MAMETSGIMPVMDMNRGYNYDNMNGGWWWIVVIFALLGFGRNNGEGCVTPVQMQNGFDTNEIINKLNGLENGLCDGFYAMNTGLLNGFAQTKDAIGQVRFDTQVQTGEINKGICGLKYDNAMQTQAIMQNENANTQRILDAFNKSKADEMQNRINQLELQNALCGVVRYPNATTFTAGINPFLNSGCCGYGA